MKKRLYFAVGALAFVLFAAVNVAIAFALKNITFGKDTPFAEHLTPLRLEGLQPRLQDAVSNRTDISGGQKQRLVLIRALASHPSIVILDEPHRKPQPGGRKGSVPPPQNAAGYHHHRHHPCLRGMDASIF